ncbi:hypothetical protein CAEBREN_12559 [Caenorhabditis brenneri]|uniref:Uncharacterized protein n=1 Tax=Caenorhabditis brenneri TaxID=135651 RepID=G0NJE9_CAEBE|nr:hypothetical protein CAEBREN_12559 [Caenorhabditis brenneri]
MEEIKGESLTFDTEHRRAIQESSGTFPQPVVAKQIKKVRSGTTTNGSTTQHE